MTRNARVPGAARRSSRLDRLSTVLPILRVALIGLVIVSFALAALATVGIDVKPFLVGAGLIGIALTFGFRRGSKT